MSGAAVVIVVVGIVLIWAVFVRPQRKAQREAIERRRRVQEDVRPGTEVVTAGGMFVTVVEDRGDELLVELSPGVLARIDRYAVYDLAPGEDEDSVNGEVEPVNDGDGAVAQRQPSRDAS